MPRRGTQSVAARAVAPEVPLSDKRAFLASGAPWPGEPAPDCVETHASLVFLTRDRAWKLKKPVHLMHVDQRSLETRAFLCHEEVRLNRELAGDVYRGMTPLVLRRDGALALGGEGRVVDWLIETIRLPAAEMLDRRLESGPAPKRAQIAAVCDVMTAFYRARQPSPGDAFFARLLRDARTAQAHLREMVPRAGVDLPAHVMESAAPMIRRCAGEIAERAGEGLTLEGHGDLRAEHVCLTDPPVVFDRLEIDHGLRLVDPFFEMNALGLECGLAGAEWIGPLLLDRLAEAFAPPSRALLAAYGVLACLNRARFAVDHFRDSDVSTPDKWRERAARYLDAAERLTAQARAF